MGQVLSNLIIILFRRKNRVETTDEENGNELNAVIHPSYGYGNTRVSEIDEGAVGTDISDADPVGEDVDPFSPASGDRKEEVDEGAVVIFINDADQVGEDTEPPSPESCDGKTRSDPDSKEKDEGAVVIFISDDDQVSEDVQPFPLASEDQKTRVSEDERVKTIFHISTGDQITVLKDEFGRKAPNGRILKEERRIKHYYSSHKILLVGEGDFSFSACLAKVFGSADNMIATSLDSEGFLKKHYRKAMSNINDLKSRGCVVLHEVDATTMSSGHEFLKGMRFDRIIFNFPYAGFFKEESRESQLSRHQELITFFFKNAKKMLSKGGEIHISHKSNGFHSEWNLKSLASLSGLNFIKSVSFKLNDYPGYSTKFGFGGDGYFFCYPSMTYMFGL